jgi:hypothetical protein
MSMTRAVLMILLAAFVVAATVTATPAAAQTETVLHSFHQDGTDGTDPRTATASPRLLR